VRRPWSLFWWTVSQRSQRTNRSTSPNEPCECTRKHSSHNINASPVVQWCNTSVNLFFFYLSVMNMTLKLLVVLDYWKKMLT